MNKLKSNKSKQERNILWASVIVLLVFGLATLFQEEMWGLNHYTFLMPGALVIFLLLFSIFWVFSKPLKVNTSFVWNKKVTILVAAIISGIAFSSFPIYNDYYGDAPRHKLGFGEQVQTLNIERTNNLYSLNILDPKNGEKTVLNAVEKLSFYLDLKVVEVFRWIGSISGVLFVLIWMSFLVYYIQDNTLRIILALLGLFAPFLQLFFGHVEIYAPVIPIITAYLISVLIYFKSQNKKWLWALSILFLISLKLHFVSVILFPSLIYCMLYNKPLLCKKPFGWKMSTKWIIFPIIIFGWGAYFFWFEDYNDPRFLDGKIDDLDRLFLPLLSPESPLDRYNLFSFNHLLDFFNVFFLWSGLGVFLLTVSVLMHKKINWNKPEIVVLGITLILFASFFFMINPLLSMPMDWDLFSIPGPLFILFIVAIIKEVEKEKWIAYLLWPSIVLSFFTVSRFYTNSSPQANKDRLVVVGKHVFKTYWIRSAGTVLAGLDLNKKEDINKLELITSELEEFADPENDIEYTILLMNLGKYYRTHNQVKKGLEYHLKAFSYSPNYEVNYIGLMESYYRLGRFREALDVCEKLIIQKYPSESESLKMGIDCALQAKDNHRAISYSNKYLALVPNDKDISELRKNLANN